MKGILFMYTNDNEDLQIKLENMEKALALSSQFTKKYNFSPPVRPCVALMMDKGFEKGEFPDRTLALIIIASEFKRCGSDSSDVYQFAKVWNQKNKPPLPDSVINSKIRTAYRKDYNYSCKNQFLQLYCIGEDCPQRDKNNKNSQKYDLFDFIEKEYQFRLNGQAKLILLLAIPLLEKRQGVGTGGTIVASYRQIARIIGASYRHIDLSLVELLYWGLIKFKPGKPNRRERTASEISRIFPFPLPNGRKEKLSIKELEKMKKQIVNSGNTNSKIENKKVDIRSIVNRNLVDNMSTPLLPNGSKEL